MKRSHLVTSIRMERPPQKKTCLAPPHHSLKRKPAAVQQQNVTVSKRPCKSQEDPGNPALHLPVHEIVQAVQKMYPTTELGTVIQQIIMMRDAQYNEYLLNRELRCPSYIN